MAQSFMISPGVNVSEFSITNIIPSVSSTIGALAGVFRWGPIGERITLGRIDDLETRLSTPTNLNAETWFTAFDFLNYGDNEIVVRAAETTGTGNVNVVDAAAVVTNASSNVGLANTTGLTVGQILFYSNTTALVASPQAEASITHVNSTSIGLSSPARSTTTGANLVFRDNLTYAAVSQEVQNPNIAWQNQLVLNNSDYSNHDGLFHASVQWVARYGGYKGNSLRLTQCDTEAQFSSVLDLGVDTANVSINATASYLEATAGSSNVVITVTPANTAASGDVSDANTIIIAAHAALVQSDLIQVGNSSIGFEFVKIETIGAVQNDANVFSFTVTLTDDIGLIANTTNTSVSRFWEFYNLAEQPPTQSDYVLSFGNTSAQDELHVVVVDENGEFSGRPGEVLEVYKNVSRATDALNADGSANYYKNVINSKSQYVWFANDRTTAVSNTSPHLINSSATAPYNTQFYGGSDGKSEANISLAAIQVAYNLFADVENVDVSLVMQGKPRGSAIAANTELGNFLIGSLAERRKDCVVFVSPDSQYVVNNRGEEASDLVAARNFMPTSSYGIMDSGYKYRYDRYNDLYRWTPLNGDIAGLCARTDQTNAPWWSPAGLNRGNIKNVVRLPFNPNHVDRDTLYKNSINPVVTFPGQGTILYGDKTLLTKPDAFDRINVRRLFIVLEKAISTAAKYMLFEFNDAFTRSQFKSMVNPYLKNVQGQRGIYDFLVVCDSTNNTPNIIDANQFVGDIYIKPARSINYIQLNFVAVATGVSFTEIVGKFGGLGA